MSIQKIFLKDLLTIRDKVFRLTKPFLVTKEEAEDFTHGEVLKLWEMDDQRLNKLNTIQAYSMIIGKNYCLDLLKSKQAKVIFLDQRIAISKTISPQKIIGATDEVNWASKLIDQLHKKERMIIQLREIEHY